MGVVARYFQRLASIVGRRQATPPAVSADVRGLDIGTHRVLWSEVHRLYAFKRDIFVGDCICLAILAADDRLFEINETSPGWKEAGNAIERFLPGSLPNAEWTLRLMAVKPGESVEIYRSGMA